MARVSFDNVGRSFVVGTLAEVWRVGSRFVVTPIVLAHIGLAGYGVWTLIFSLSAYVSIANVGFGVSYVKFTAECVRVRDYARLRSILGAGTAVVGAFAVVGVAVAWLGGQALLRWLNVPAQLIGDAHVAMLIVIAVLVLRLTIGCSFEVLSGLQRVDLSHRLTIFASFVEMVVTVPLLVLGHGLVGMAIGHAVGQTAAFVLGRRWVKREDPRVSISPIFATRAGLHAVLRIGGPMQGLAFLQVVIGEGVKVLLSVLIDPRATALYGLADKLVQLARTPVTAVVAPLLAVFADLQAAGERAREHEVIHRAGKAVAIVGGGVAVFVAVTAVPALLAWTGQHMPQAAWAVQVLVLANLVPQQSAVLTASLRAKGTVRLELAFALITTVVGIAVLLAIVRIAPFEAVVWTRAASVTVAGAWFLGASLRQVRLDTGSWYRGIALARVLGVISVASVLLVFVRALVDLPEVTVSPRWRAVIELVVCGLAYGSILGVGAWRYVLDLDERAIVSRSVARRR